MVVLEPSWKFSTMPVAACISSLDTALGSKCFLPMVPLFLDSHGLSAAAPALPVLLSIPLLPLTAAGRAPRHCAAHLYLWRGVVAMRSACVVHRSIAIDDRPSLHREVESWLYITLPEPWMQNIASRRDNAVPTLFNIQAGGWTYWSIGLFDQPLEAL